MPGRIPITRAAAASLGTTFSGETSLIGFDSLRTPDTSVLAFGDSRGLSPATQVCPFQ